VADVTDPRWDDLARLLVERSLDVQPRWQVAIRSSPLARPLVEAVCRRIARRGAYALARIVLGHERWPMPLAWAEEAPLELLGELAPLDLREAETLDARLLILSPEVVRHEPPLPDERRRLVQAALRPYSRRARALDVRWAVTQFPTEAAATAAGLTVAELTEFLFGACLRDWDAERERMRRVAERFDRAEEIRVVGARTELRLSVAGRRCEIDHGLRNMPGGEVFLCPLEDSAEGVVTYGELPAHYLGTRVEGARLAFRGGEVVEASAAAGEEILLQVLDTDDGARRLGELGIGCNPGITRAMGTALFDEKIDGTVHLALGAGYTFLGGTNESSIHWDMVKDLRRGGELWADGELVQRDGAWLI
jgi:aminopeptidase